MSHTNLDRVKHLIKGIIHTNDLNILEVAQGSPNRLVALNTLEHCAISVWSQLNIAVFFHQDLTVFVYGRQHLLGKEDKRGLLSSKVGIICEKLDGLGMIFVVRHNEHLTVEY